ncbi:MAG TPA: hypothetical protein VMK30_06355 [Pleomorphomonadaceae bacterium]|nr:hypothetical protein [Pleomorphomonadaceae bacterium]
MNARRDPDRLIHAFLKEGQTELPDQIYDSVRDRIETTRQRAVIGPWRTPDVNRYLKIGLAAAAVVVIAVIAFNLLPGSPAPGGEPSATPEPSVGEPSAAEPSTAAGLPVGSTFDLAYGADQLRIPVTIPAPGWFGEPGSGFITKNDHPGSPDGAGMITFQGDLYVYGDPCAWSTTRPDTPATTVDELVAALSAQASRDASAAVDITVDGYGGKSITLHVPDDAAYSADEFTDCDQGYFSSWGVPGEDPARYHQGPGQIDELWILDVGGVMVVIDTAYYAGTPAEHVEEMRAIVESATFEMP